MTNEPKQNQKPFRTWQGRDGDLRGTSPRNNIKFASVCAHAGCLSTLKLLVRGKKNRETLSAPALNQYAPRAACGPRGRPMPGNRCWPLLLHRLSGAGPPSSRDSGAHLPGALACLQSLASPFLCITGNVRGRPSPPGDSPPRSPAHALCG